jgi:6-phosphogluconolactonase
VALDLRVYADVSAVSLGAAEHAASVMIDAVERRSACRLVLSGGATPRTLYELLATRFRDRIPWAHVHVFWADERYVPADHPLNNARMAREILLSRVPCPPGQVHPMPTDFASPDAAARDYERTLRAQHDDEWPRMDLVILGIGQEGHTASIFPASPAVSESERWVLAVQAPVEPATRLTLTLPVLTHAANMAVLVTGSAKAIALGRLRLGTSDPEAFPAAGLLASSGSLTIWADHAAVDASTHAE